MNRYIRHKKTFLKSLFGALSIIAFGLALWVIKNYLFFTPESNAITIGSYQQFQNNPVIHKIKERIFIIHDEEGVYAITDICTHNGCPVTYENNRFRCPCHGAEFTKNGMYISGPVNKSLDHYSIYKDQSNNLVVDLTQTVTKEFRYSE
jgi:Rieske Fe-S protein